LDSDLIALVTPERYVILTLTILGTALSALLLAARPFTRLRRYILSSLALLCLSLGSVAYAHNFLAYDERTVAFESAGVNLVGTLYQPESSIDGPALVFVHGSGKFPRRMYHVWADYFVRRGITVLVYDKRGVGDSGGEYEWENNSSEENFIRLAKDASAATDWLAQQPGINRERIGIWAISQGGWIAPITCSLNSNLSFAIFVSGPTVSVGEEGRYSELTGDGHEGVALSGRAELDSAMQDCPPSGFDPERYVRALEIPTLWLYGSDDMSIPVTKSVARLSQWQQAHPMPWEYRVYTGSDHLLLHASDSKVVPIPDFTDGALQEMADWALHPGTTD
jgi:dipeptidyl aminopeptidase/acylaminoacyl peptidase